MKEVVNIFKAPNSKPLATKEDMTKEELIKIINQDIDEYDKYEFPHQDKLDYLKQVVHEMNKPGQIFLLDIDSTKVMESIIIAHNPEISIELAKELSNQLKSIIDNLNPEDIYSLREYFSYCNIFWEEDEFHLLISSPAVYEDYLAWLETSIHEYAKKFEDSTSIIFPKDPKDKENEMGYDYEKRNKLFNKIFAHCDDFKCFVAIAEFFTFRCFKNSKEYSKLSAKDIRRHGKKFNKFLIDKLKKLTYLSDGLNHLNNYYKGLSDDLITEKKQIDKIKQKYQKLLKIIEFTSEKEIFILPAKIKNQINSDYVLSACQRFAAAHNAPIFEAELQKNVEYKKNAATNIEIIFSKNGFDFNKLSEENRKLLIESANGEAIDKLLKAIIDDNFGIISEDYPDFIDILLYSNVGILQYLRAQVEKGNIDYNFIARNKDILIIKEGLKDFKNFSEILTTLENNGINIAKSVKNNEGIYRLDSSDVRHRVSLLTKLYGLNLANDAANHYDIIEDMTLLDLLDDFIELGYGEVVRKNPHYVSNDSSDIVKRLFITNLINMDSIDIVNANGNLKKMIRTGDNFFQGADKLDEFISDYGTEHINEGFKIIFESSARDKISDEALSHPYIIILNQKHSDEDVYEIGDFSFSKNRVLRNLTILLESTDNKDDYNLIFQSFLYKSISLNEPEYVIELEQTLKAYLNNGEPEKGKSVLM